MAADKTDWIWMNGEWVLFGIVSGGLQDRHGWPPPVPRPAIAAAGA